jgi:hypothetical protein
MIGPVLTVIRTFGTQHISRVLELPIEPATRRIVRLPGGLELQITKVVLCARAPSDFTPGWKAAAMTEVWLEPEPADGLQPALKDGWTRCPTKDVPAPVPTPRRTVLAGGAVSPPTTESTTAQS